LNEFCNAKQENIEVKKRKYVYNMAAVKNK